MNKVSVLDLRKCFLVLAFLGGFFGFSSQSMAQTPGLIYKKAIGTSILDPNGDGYSSLTTAGFISNDESESEIPFVPLPIVEPEPDSDLGPGPNCGFTDLVKSSDNETLYTYSDGTNLYFRFRLGGTASNSKGYSIWLDTDQAFGADDANPVAGNPGFEVEISLQTNFGVGVYTIDGTTSPTEYTAPASLPYDNYCQKSIALSTECGSPDYFYDFFVPYANLPFSSNTPVRMIGTTVINPHAGTGNNGISDLGGIDDATGTFDALAEALIGVYPPTSGDDVNSGTPILPRAKCPGIDGPIAVGATSVSGTSLEADGTVIEVFKDAVSVGTTTVTGGIWSITGLTALVATEEITATADIAGVKSTSTSNCNATTVGSICSDPPFNLLVIAGGSGKGFTGNISGLPSTSYLISIYDNATGTLWTGTPSTTSITTDGTGAGSFTMSCGTGNCLAAGSYYLTAQGTGECESEKAYICNGGTAAELPTFNAVAVYETTSSVSGTLANAPSAPNSTIILYINGIESGFSTTTTNTSWTISGISGLVNGDVLTAYASESGECPTASSNSLTVQVQSATPIIKGSYCGAITTVNGISSETPGSTITLYYGASPITTASSSATTTVAANGSWSITISLSAGTFMAATAQTAGELESNLSPEVEVFSQTTDASLSISSNPITEGDNSITGNGTDGNIIQLYIDDVLIDGFTATVGAVTSGVWTISGLDAASAGYDVLYAESRTQVTATNGALCESALVEATALTECNTPTTQGFTPVTTITDCETEAITFQLASTEDLVVYQLIDQSGTPTGSSILGNGGALNISTGALNTSMTSISVKALRIGITCETIFGTTAINVNPLPTISLGTNPIVCQGETSTSLTYSATTNSPNEYSIDFDATAEGEGFVDINNAILPASPITITVPGAAAGGTYNANLIVTNTSTGCSSVSQAITIQVVDNVVALGTISDPTTCGGTDGSIQLTGLLASTSYTVDYVDDGVATSTSLSSSPAGNILINGLNAGAYTNISVTYLGCESNIISSASLNDPGAPNIIFNTQSNPSTCSGTDGTISIMNLAGNTLYDISYFVDATPTSVTGVNSDAGGNLIINNLNEGSYTQINVVNPSGCKSNSLAGPFTLTDPAAPTITLGTNPSVAQGSTTANLPYSSLTGGADQYSIDFNAAAEAEGFVDVSFASITASPISITVPAAAAQATYNATIIVNNSTTLCQSGTVGFTITITAPADVTPPAAAISGQPAIVNDATPYNVTVDFGEVVTGFVSTEVVVGNGSVTGFTDNGDGTYTVEITPDGTGDITIDVAANVAQDAAGNNNTAATQVSTIYDTTAPAAAISGQPAIVNDATPYNVTVDFGEVVTGFVSTEVVVGNGSVTGFTDNGDGTYTVEITPDGTGDITIDVAANVAQDAAGNNNTAATQVSTIYDTTAPAAAISGQPAIVNDATPYNVTVDFGEVVTGFVSTEVVVGNGSVTGFTDNGDGTYTVEITPDGTGDITINVAANVAQDAAGNNNTAATQVSTIYDTTAPAAAISGQPAIVNDATPYNVTVDFGEVVTGFVSTEVVVGNGSVTGFTDNGDGTYTVEITPDGTGDITINVAANVAQDAAGNNNTAATQVSTIYDTTAPAAAISGQPAIVNDATPYNVTVDFGEVVTGFVSTEVVVGNGSVTGFTDNGDGTYTVEITPDGTGDITIDVAANVAQDAAGNNNTAATQVSTTFDTTAPAAAISGQPAIVNDATPYNVTVDFGEVVTGFVSTEVVVGNGSVTGFTDNGDGTYTVEITPDGTGDITIDVAANVAQDAAGNNNTAATQVSTTFDNTAPAAAISGQPAIVNDATPYNVTVDFGEVVTGFVSTEVVVGNGSVTGFTDNGDGTYTVEITPDGTGDITIDVAANVAQDAAGNNNTAATQVGTTFDNTAPAAAISGQPAIVNDATPYNVTVDFGEVVTGFVSTEVVVGNGSVTGFTDNGDGTYTVEITPDGTGDITIDVAANVAQDAAGNNNTAATQVSTTFDTGVPSVDIQGEPVIVNSTAVYNVTIQFSEDVTGFVEGDISVGNGSTSNFVVVNASTYTVDITPDGTGDITIDVAANVAQDGALNNNTAAPTATTIYDTTAPAAVISGQPAIVNDATPYNVTVDFGEVVTGFVSTEVVVGNGSVTGFTDNGDGTYTVEITPDGTGDITIDVTANVAQDAAGNNNTAATQVSTTFDTTAPAAVISGQPAIVNDATPYNVTVDFGEVVTGFVSTEVVVGNGSVTGFTDNGDGTYTVEITPDGTGDITIDVAANVAQDAAGNNNTAATQVSTTFDTGVPSVDIQGEPVIVNSTAVYNVTIQFSEDVTGFVEGDISVGNGSTSNFVVVNASTYTVDITPDGTGDITIDVAANVAQDGALNNNTAAPTATTIYDTTAPAAVISGQPAIVNDATPYNVTVDFGEVVTGFVSTEVVVGNGSVTGFTDNGDGTYTVEITPDGTGDITIDVAANVAQDAAGNNNTAATQVSTTFDTTAPAAVISGQPAIVNDATPYNVTVDFGEVVTGFVSTEVVVGNGSVTGFTDNGDGTYTVEITPDGAGDITIDVAANVAQDAAGNNNTAATQVSTTFDTTAPAAAISGQPAIVNDATPYNVTVDFGEVVTGFVSTEVVVGNGSVTGFTDNGDGTYTVEITPDGTGDITIDVAANVAQDAAGNNNTAATQAVTIFDNTAPAASISAPAFVNQAYSVIVDFGEIVTGFVSGDITVTNASIIAFSDRGDGSYTIGISPSSTGDITVGVPANVAQDAAGNNNTAATDVTTAYDNTPPMMDIQGEPAIVNSTASYNVTIEFSEDVTGFVVGDIAVGNGSASNFVVVNASTYTVDITPSGAGDITIDVAANVAQDAAGNNNIAATQAVTTFDATAPTVDIQDEPAIVNSTASYNVTIEFSEDVTGFVAGDITVGNGSASNFVAVDGNTYTVDITPSGAGDITIDVSANVAQDAAGNNNTAATQVSTTFDNTAPAVPTVNALTTADGTPLLTGTAEIGSTVVVVINGVSFTTTADGSGNWSVDTGVDTPTAGGPFTALADGDYDVTATSSDAAGNSTADATTNEVTIDSTGPTAPTVDLLTTNDLSPVITGTNSLGASQPAGETLTVTVNGATYTVVPDASGNWSVDTGVDTPTSGTLGTFSDGVSYEVVATVTDGGSNSASDATTNELTIDTTAPAVPTVVSQTTNDTTPVITGTAEAGSSVTVVVGGATYTVTADGSGNWTLDTGTATPDSGTFSPNVNGSNEVAVTSSDAAGNATADATTGELIIDTTAPTTPTVNALTTADGTPLLTGTAEIGSTVVVVINGVSFTTTADGSGNWSVDTGVDTPTAGGPFTALADGDYDVTATSSDAAGNSTADATTNEVTIDSTGPTAPTVDLLTTNDLSPVITGTNSLGASQPAGETLTVTVNGATYTVVPDASGNWSVDTGVDTPTSGTLGTFSDGVSYEVVATVTDGGSNSASDATTNELTIDTTAPAVPTVVSQTTNDTTPVITGTAEAGSSVTVVVGGATYTVTADGSGNWTLDTGTATPDSGTFSPNVNGSNEVAVTSSDAAGNATADATTGELIIDTTAPTTPTVNALTTADGTPLLTGTAEIGSTVVVVINGVSFTTTADGSGNWSVDTGVDTPTAGGPFTALADGDYDVTATSSDAAGNSTADATTNEVTIDSTGPTAPTVDLLTTNDLSPVITGTNSLGASQPAGETLTVTVNGATYTVVPDASGNWSVDTGVDTPTSGTLGTFSDGVSYEVVATVTDGGSNSASDATTNELTIDTTAPAVPTVVSQTTNDTTPVITGTAEAGSSVTVVVGGATYTVTADGSGNWTLDTGTATPDSGTFSPNVNGSNEVAVTSSDAAGNATADATTGELIIDTTAPATPTVNALTTADGTPLLTGTAEIGSTVVVVINGVSFTTTADGSGNWSVDTGVDTPTAGGPFTALADGDYDVTATSSDAAGNSTADATTNEVTIDSTGPTAPTVDLLTTNDLSPVITGTNSLGASQPAGETLTVTVNGATYTVVPDASGNWSVDTGVDTPTSGTLGTFSDGVSYEVVATVTDGGSNSASDATTNELTIDTTAPAIPTVVSQTTNDTTPVITGTAEAGSSVTVVVGGATYTVTADGSGNWTLDTGTATPDSGTFSPNVNGSNEVAVTSTDAAGNSTADGTNGELIIDTTAPATPTVNALTTADGTPLLTGTAEIGSTVVVVINGVSFTTTADGSGNWSVDTGVDTPTAGGPFTALADGDYDVTATSSDAAGNSTADATTNEVTIDSSAPATPTVNTLTSTDGLPTLTGTWDEANATVLEVTVNGVTYVLGTDAELTTDGSGNWTLDLTALSTALTDGAYDVLVSISDGSTTVTDATTDELTVVITSLTVPTVNTLTSTDGLPTLTGTWDEANATVLEVTVNGVTYVLGTDAELTTDGSGNWTLDLTALSTPLTDGAYDVLVSISDGSTTVTDATTDELTVVITSLTVPTVNNLTSTDGLPTLTGTWDAANATVLEVTVDGVTYVLGTDAELTTDGSGNWTLDLTALSTPLTDGAYDVLVSISDGSTTVTDATTDELTVVITSLTVPTVNTLTSTDGLPTLTGTWDEANATELEVTVDGVTYVLGTDAELTTDGSGNWTLDLTALSTALIDGAYDVLVSISDGSTTVTDATTDELTVVITSLTVPTVNTLTSTDGLPTLTGTWDEANATVLEVTVDGVTYVLGTDAELTTDGSGNWTLDLTGLSTPLTDGAYDVLVSISDGSTTVTDATTDELTVVITSLTVPTVNNLTSTDGLPTLTGTWDEANATELEVTVDGVTYVLGTDAELTTDGSGNWTLDLTALSTPLTDGAYDVLVSISDGSTTVTDATTDELTVVITSLTVPTVNNLTSTDGLPTLTGTWDAANATELEVTVDGVTYVLGTDAELTTDGSGNWTLDLTGLSTPLTDGAYDVLVSISDGSTTVTDATTDELTVVITSLTVPTVNTLTSTDGLPTLTGTWDEANATELEVTVDGVTYVLGTDAELTTDGSGNWTLDLTGLSTPLTDGAYDVLVSISDGSTTVTDATTDELTVDVGSIDSDGDGVIDTDEDIDGDGDPTNDDTDGDGIPDYLDEDDDGDGIPTADEDIDGDGDPTNDDTDGDGIPDYLDEDDDGDGVPTSDEDIDGDGDPTNDDTDGDGIPDYLDEDDDGDGVPTSDEDIDGDGDPTNDDTDGDGIPDYLDEDDDGDGVPTSDEDIDGDGDPTNDDTDGDGIPDYLDEDDDGDGVPTSDEDIDGDGDPTNDDTDGDGIPDYLDEDDDGDGVPTTDEDIDGDGDPTNDDTDGDGIPDYLDEDDDGDGVPTTDEDIDGDGDPTNDDTDGDGIPDYLDEDDDGDGVPTTDEDIDGDGDPTNDDTDGDGIPDYLDAIDDRTGSADLEIIKTVSEGPYLSGELVVYTLIIKNNGPNNATGVTVFENLSFDLLFINAEATSGSYSDSNGEWTIGDMLNGQIDSLVITARINSTGRIDNEAEIVGVESDPDETNNLSDLISIEVLDEFEVTGGFSPNGDGNNDVWQIKGIENYPDNNVKVFNRWGNEVFSVKGYNNTNNGWSGEVNARLVLSGTDVPDGTYFYLIDLGDGSKPLTGYITIKR